MSVQSAWVAAMSSTMRSQSAGPGFGVRVLAHDEVGAAAELEDGDLVHDGDLAHPDGFVELRGGGGILAGSRPGGRSRLRVAGRSLSCRYPLLRRLRVRPGGGRTPPRARAPPPARTPSLPTTPSRMRTRPPTTVELHDGAGRGVDEVVEEVAGASSGAVGAGEQEVGRLPHRELGRAAEQRARARRWPPATPPPPAARRDRWRRTSGAARAP